MAGHEPTKAALRGAISALASQGIRPPAPSRQNPAYTHDPHFEAMAAIAGACTLIAEKIATLGPHFILKGFLDEAMRSRNVNTFRSGRDALQQLMDAADAQ
ncbi:hypothetical protein [Synechococcus phage Yong-M4-211]|nr:hypothetical protein [Synechococcus phage Yong-M4-211]